MKNNHSHNQMQTSMRSSGFTLIEIMIAISLSLFLIAGLIQVYLSSKTSSRNQQQLAAMKNSQRLTLDILSRNIRMAGFSGASLDASKINLDKFYADKTDKANSTQDGGSNDSDIIAVQFESPVDCLGFKADDTDANGELFAINTFFIKSNTLYCLGNSGADSQPIADNVANMQILYGENTDPPNMEFTSAPTANRYVTFDQVDDPNNIVSVRIALLFTTPNAVKTKKQSITYQLLDAPALEFDDKFRRELITTTIALRN